MKENHRHDIIVATSDIQFGLRTYYLHAPFFKKPLSIWSLIRNTSTQVEIPHTNIGTYLLLGVKVRNMKIDFDNGYICFLIGWSSTLRIISKLISDSIRTHNRHGLVSFRRYTDLQNVTFWQGTRCGWMIFDKMFWENAKNRHFLVQNYKPDNSGQLVFFQV